MTRRSVLRSSLVLAAAGIRVAGQRCERGTQPPGAAPNPLGLTASVQPSPDPRCRLVLAHLEHAPCRLELGPDAPPSHEGARECRISEVDREGVIQHAAHP